MSFHKSCYFINYKFFIKLLLLLILCCLSVCCGEKQSKQSLSTENRVIVSESAVNINTASTAELEKIPNIGVKTAQEIIEYREKFGKFRKPEYLMLVPRISDKRFREIRHLIKTE
jgi:competence ComEA-like helix-hairpin-helix protein